MSVWLMLGCALLYWIVLDIWRGELRAKNGAPWLSRRANPIAFWLAAIAAVAFVLSLLIAPFLLRRT